MKKIDKNFMSPARGLDLDIMQQVGEDETSRAIVLRYNLFVMVY